MNYVEQLCDGFSTTDIFETNDMFFVIRFVESRKKLDYTFHTNYIPERQLLQDQIISEYLEKCTYCKRKELILTGGAMGAGKGHILRQMHNNKELNLNQFVIADSDKLKYDLPEMQILLRCNKEFAGTLVHKESIFIQELLFREAIAEEQCVIIDGSLKDAEWHKKFILEVRKEHPDYKIKIIHVKAPFGNLLKQEYITQLQNGSPCTGTYNKRCS